MPYAVHLGDRAERQVQRLSTAAQKRIHASLEALKVDPFQPRPKADIKLLGGGAMGHRLRVGDYRIFYVVDGGDVYVTQVRHRSHAYD